MMVAGLEIPKISLRHLRAVLWVADVKQISLAALEMSKSQPAITKSIASLENRLQLKLFERSTYGMLPTPYGEVLANSTRKALREFENAGWNYSKYVSNRGFQKNPVFSMDISYGRLAAVIALKEYLNCSKAAQALGITPNGVYASIRQIELLLGIRLFERGVRGIVATEYCDNLVPYIKRAFAHICTGLEGLDNIKAGNCGRLNIGALSSARAAIVPNLISRLLGEYPGLTVSTREGQDQALVSELREGTIDLLVGGLDVQTPAADLVSRPLFKERFCFLVRPDHPLCFKQEMDVADLRKFSWVLPPRNVPSRQVIDKLLNHLGISPPDQCIETSSYITTRGLLLESDSITLLSQHLTKHDVDRGMLIALPVLLDCDMPHISVTMRANITGSPAVALCLQQLSQISLEGAQSRRAHSGSKFSAIG